LRQMERIHFIHMGALTVARIQCPTILYFYPNYTLTQIMILTVTANRSQKQFLLSNHNTKQVFLHKN
jgi:hypothetical protein